MVITGYKISSTDLKNINLELDRVKRGIENIASKSYHKLLGEEIAFICDNICLGSMTRNETNTIFENAVGNLEFKLKNASASGAANKYNFSIFAHILPYEDNTYIRVTSPNLALLNAFDKLEDYSLNETECKDEKNKKTILWNKIHAIYKKSEPMIMNLQPQIIPDKEKIVYPDKQDRAETHARHSIMNHLLNQISGGKEIPPILLMNYMDLALEMLQDESVEYKKKVAQLMQIFTDLSLTNDFIFTNSIEK